MKSFQSPFDEHQEVHYGESLQQAIHSLLHVIKKHSEMQALYCYGLRKDISHISNLFAADNKGDKFKWHFHLVSVSEDNRGTADLMDLVEKESKGAFVATILECSPKQLLTSNKEQLYFFTRIIESGWLIHGKAYELSASQPHLIEEGVNRICIYSHNRIAIAQKSLALSALASEQPLLAASLLHTSVEQLCLGMLYAFLQMRPNHFHIKYLLRLCSQFSSLPEVYFLENPVLNTSMLEILCTNRHKLRFRNTEIYSKREMDFMLQICTAFADGIVPCIEEQLQKIKIKCHGKGEANSKAQ